MVTNREKVAEPRQLEILTVIQLDIWGDDKETLNQLGSMISSDVG